MQMGEAVVCVNVRPSKKRVWVQERKRMKNKMCEGRKTFKRQHNGQHFTVFIQKSEGLNAGELLIVKTLKTDGFITGKKK